MTRFPGFTAFDAWKTRQPGDGIQLDACSPLERIVVRTGKSVYEVIVVCGDAAEVLVRGGHFFPEFRRAILAGCTAGGTALKLRSLDVGYCMELHAEGKAFVTSPIRALSRPGAPPRSKVA
jgi:hypothetical protein